MHNALRVAGILAFAFGLFLVFDGVYGISGPNQPTTSMTSTATSSGASSTTTTTSFTATNGSIKTTTITITVTTACSYPGFGQAVVSVTSTTTSCLPPNYAGSLNVNPASGAVGTNFNFYGQTTNNGIGIAAGGQPLSLMSGSSVLAVFSANSDGSFSTYLSFGSAGTYSVFLKLPDGHTTNTVTVTVGAYVPAPTLEATSGSLLSMPRIYWDVLGLPANKPITLLVHNIPMGNSFQVATTVTNAQGAASGSFVATTAMVGSDQLFTTDPPLSTYFTVSSGYTYPQSILGISGTGLYAESALGIISTIGGIMLLALGSRKKSL